MAIRMTGMISNMDTESLIKELMQAQSSKKTKVEQKKTKLEWKQDKWAELNTKLYKLYTDQLSKVRLSSNYATKKVTSSNEDIVTATASTEAGSGSHVLEIGKLASAQYVTGNQVSGLSKTSKLTEAGLTEGMIIKITSGTGSNAQVNNLEVTAETTINDLVATMTKAGLNASFDEGQGRFFISGKKSGEENKFSIETYKMDTSATDALNQATEGLKAAGMTDSQISSYRSAIETLNVKQAAYDAAPSDRVTAWTELQTAKKAVADLEESFYTSAASKEIINERLAALKEAQAGSAGVDESVTKAYKEIEDAVQKQFYELNEDGSVKSGEFSETALDAAKSAIMKEATDAVNTMINEGTVDFDSVEEREAAIQAKYQELVGSDENAALKAKAQENYDTSLKNALENSAKSYVSTTEGAALVSERAEIIKATSPDIIGTAAESYKTAVTNYNNVVSDSTADDSNRLTGHLGGLGLSDIVDGVSADSSLNITQAQNSEITLDGALLTGTGNSFTVAGVTYDLKNVTEGAKVSLTVSNDTQAVYDMVKNFVKGYNEILTEMNTLYYADSSRGYEPLTDDEKEAMSDSQVELWEKKIKDSLLRRDDSLGSLMTSMRSSLQTSVTVNGKNYSLASFGICTGDYTEKGLLHIYGDSDDTTYGDKTNLLMKMFAENPDDATEALSGIMKNLYGTMQDKMKTSSVSSALTFYNDKQMKKDVTTYTKQISTWETRLEDMENRYYKQFSAMETALAKLQSQSNSLASMLGNG